MSCCTSVTSRVVGLAAAKVARKTAERIEVFMTAKKEMNNDEVKIHSIL
jgi:hypothetical protein